MSWIRTIDEREATGLLARVYETIAGAGRRVANILKIQSPHPEGLREHDALYRTLMFGPSPSEIAEGDLEPLRGEGLDDRAILDVVQVAAYYNFVNRLADALGVEPER